MVEQQEKMLLLIRMPDEIQERARRGEVEEVIFEISQRLPKEDLVETATGAFLGIATICILLIIAAIIMRKNK